MTMPRVLLILLMLYSVCGSFARLAFPVDEAFHRGIAAYREQDYATALRAWRPLAQRGDALAQTWLGWLYEQGQGVVKDEAEAVQWYRKAAAQGNDDAQKNLGVLYTEGRGVAQDAYEAVRWYRKAALQGNASAQHNLGVLYTEGHGVVQDDATALQWYRKATLQGHAPAQYALGRWYEQGKGVAQDIAEAQLWYAKAAETYPPGADRLKAFNAYERLKRQFPTAQPLAPPVVAPPTQAQSRRALVVGISAYRENPLANAVNDATDMAAFLRRFGFDVTLERNADKLTIEKAVNHFIQGAPRSSVGLFFYAGHGLQIDGVNYLVPLDARFTTASDIKYHAISADWVLARMDESGMDVKLVFLDACRNNPLGRSWTRALNRGLAMMETPQGTLIAYATSPGKTASDGTGRNSPFTAQLLHALGSPGRDIEVVLKAVRAGVQQTTRGEQIPWVASSMTEDFHLAR